MLESSKSKSKKKWKFKGFNFSKKKKKEEDSRSKTNDTNEDKIEPVVLENELEILDLEEIDKFTPENLVKELTEFHTEYHKLLTLFKEVELNNREIKSQLIMCSKELDSKEEELSVFKAHNEKLQEQLKKMVEENDKSINTGNEYKDKIRELEAKITNICTLFGDESGEINLIKYEQDRKMIELEKEEYLDQLNDQLKQNKENQSSLVKKQELINDFENRIVQFEEENQILEEKLNKRITSEEDLYQKYHTLLDEYTILRDSGRSCFAKKDVQYKTLIDENLDLKKRVETLENSFKYVNSQNKTLQLKITESESKIQDRFRLLRQDAAVQTGEGEEDEESQLINQINECKEKIANLEAKLNQKDHELGELRVYNNNMKCEYDGVTEKYTSTTKRVKELEIEMFSLSEQSTQINNENTKLLCENKELQKRRSQAKDEISRLSSKIDLDRKSNEGHPSFSMRGYSETNLTNKYSGQVESMPSTPISSTKYGSSSNIYATPPTQPVGIGGGTLHYLLFIKTQMDILYKQLIQVIFLPSNEEDGKDVKINLEKDFNNLLLKVTEFCDDCGGGSIPISVDQICLSTAGTKSCRSNRSGINASFSNYNKPPLGVQNPNPKYIARIGNPYPSSETKGINKFTQLLKNTPMKLFGGRPSEGNTKANIPISSMKMQNRPPPRTLNQEIAKNEFLNKEVKEKSPN